VSLQAAERRRLQSRSEARRAILDATEALLVGEGYARFSMRKLADRCGYTAPTIYHYFGDKVGLLDALLEERLGRLVAELREVPVSRDPARNLLALGGAVARFGLRNPSHYRLFTEPREVRSEVRSKLLPSGEEARRILERPIIELWEAGRLEFESIEAARQTFWALLHGVISLRVSRPGVEWSSDLFEVALETLLRGALREAPEAREGHAAAADCGEER
jgi:AcrR family transcriptional regulator